jgi:hypothetical protein
MIFSINSNINSSINSYIVSQCNEGTCYVNQQNSSEITPQDLNNLKKELLKERKVALDASRAEGFTCVFAIPEILWGVAELCSTGLLSKMIYAITSLEELFAAAWVSNSLTSYTEKLDQKIKQVDDLKKSINEGFIDNIDQDKVQILTASKTGMIDELIKHENNDATNKFVGMLQGGIGVLLTFLAFLKFTNKDPGIFRAIERHPIPRKINEFKERMFSIFPGKSKELAEVVFLAAPMLAMGYWKGQLAKQAQSKSLASTLSGQSIANYTCAMEASGNVIQLLADEDTTLMDVLSGKSSKGQPVNGFMGRPVRNILEIPLCLWMSWNYLASSFQMLGLTKENN